MPPFASAINRMGPNAARLSSSSAKDGGWLARCCMRLQSRVATSRRQCGRAPRAAPNRAGGCGPTAAAARPRWRSRLAVALRRDRSSLSRARSRSHRIRRTRACDQREPRRRPLPSFCERRLDVLATAMRGYAHAPRTRFLSPPMLAALRDLLRTSLGIRDSTADADTRSSARGEGRRRRARRDEGRRVLHGAYDGRPSYAPAHRLLPPVVRLLPPRPS